MMRKVLLYILFFFFFGQLVVLSQTNGRFHVSNQLVSWSVTQFNDLFAAQAGGRWVPAITGKMILKGGGFVDYEVSANAYGSFTYHEVESVELNGSITPYRIWTRYGNESWEIRAGLQKINFGSARMFRPLMWFDGMDVRDPLRLTEGVYGMMSRYYFENNGSLWGWVLAANHQPKGFELFGSVPQIPEWGGRFEWPVLDGEVGAAFHHRTISLLHNRMQVQLSDDRFAENRWGVNGQWDVGVGIWFETSASWVKQIPGTTFPIPVFNDLLTIGIDYTLQLGNGPGITLEYFRYHAGERWWTGGVDMHLIGTMWTYPLTILDNISAMIFYMPMLGRDQWMSYVSWTRSYDKLSIHAIGFWNPEYSTIPGFQQTSTSMYNGKGVQIMLSYHF